MNKSDKSPKILSKNLFPVVGIGASAGGLEAFKNLIKAIPEKSGMAYILVQHLHPEYDSALPEILQKVTKIPVVEIRDNVRVAPDHIYVIPSNTILVANDGILELTPRPASKEKLNLPIDIFFSSLAVVHQSHSIGVILSGNGADGTVGLKDIKEQGGLTFAQDLTSATYDGMPQSAINAEVVDFILAPEKIPEKLMHLQRSYTDSSSTDDSSSIDKVNDDGFKQILALVRERLSVDFSLYKQTTIRRRIIRRLVILHFESVNDYLDHLKKNTNELDLLFQDMLISVTSFFRDETTFHTLCEKVFPEIIKNKTLINPLRLWIAGCSTGQEAYSMAICIQEYMNEHNSAVKVQIFATDISEKSIQKARSGTYSEKELEDVSETRRHQFFNKKDGAFQVKKRVRDMCVFATQNFLKDPPFAKMDLISCRNVLIYLEPFLQKKALTIFHYALNEKGVLLLGKSETIGSASDLFDSFGKKKKFYTRKDLPGQFSNVTNGRSETEIADNNNPLQEKEIKTDDYQKNVDAVLLAKYTPVGVIVNDQSDIVQFRGFTREYLEPSPGKASLNVLKMAKEGLAFEIRNALHKAKALGETIIKEGISINKGEKEITIEVIPVPDTIDPYFLILFREISILSNEETATGTKHSADEVQLKRIEQLEKELAQARDDMRSITEEQEAANEELQSSNEELLSGSEELQSLNEELETSKEELQSTNEELITVNQELYDRNEALDLSREFANTTISILHEPLLVLDENFLIKSANKSFYKTFELTEDKTLGKIIFQLQDNGWDIPGLRKELVNIQKEKEKMIEIEIVFEFPNIGERIICFNIQPLNRDNGEQLILLALDDITIRRNADQIRLTAQRTLEQNAEMIRTMYENSPAFVCTLQGPTHIYTLVNPAYQRLFGKRKLVGKPLMEALPELEGQDFDVILDNVYNTGEIFVGNEIQIKLASDEGHLPQDRYFNIAFQPIYNVEKKIDGILVFGNEATEQFLAKRHSESNMNQLLETIFQITVTATPEGKITFYNKYYLDYAGLTLQEATAPNSWKSIIAPEDVEEANTAAQHSISSGQDFYNELRLKRKRDGAYRWHLARATAIKDNEGNISSWVGAATDIHDQKMKDQKKDEFICIASHEMKTPLTTAKAYLQLLELTLTKENEESVLYAEKASKSITRLNDLIAELLDVSKIQSGKLNYNVTSFNFNEMIDNTIEQMQYSSKTHKIIKTGKVRSEMTGDRDRLQQVVINLISNAIKYSPDADNVSIHLSEENDAAKPGGKTIKVAVKDEGVGLAKHNIDKIFERYYRVEDGSIKFQGLGIGLFISYEIIQRHQGKIWVESELEKGSTFSFSLPINNN